MIRYIFIPFLLLVNTIFGQKLSGFIRNEIDKPIYKAYVIIDSIQFTTTNEQGYYEIAFEPNKKHQIIFTKEHYSPVIIEIKSNKNIQIDTLLSYEPLVFDTIKININPIIINNLQSNTITQEDIQNNNQQTLSQTLASQPGVSFISNGISISKPSIRGMSQTRMAVYENGLKQEGQQWGNDHGLEIDNAHIEQIDIIKGASTLKYGTDAQAGVVLIKQNHQITIGDHEGQSMYRFNSVNQNHQISANYKGRFKKSYYNLAYSSQDFGDYQLPTNQFKYLGFVLPIENNQLKNTAGEQKSAQLTYGYFGKNHQTYFYNNLYHQKAGIFAGGTGLPRGYSLANDNDSRNIELPAQYVTHFKTHIQSTINIHSNKLELLSGYQINNRKEFGKSNAHGFPKFQDSLLNHLVLHTFTLQGEYNFNLDNWELKTGLQNQIQWNQREGFDFVIPSYLSKQIGLYALGNKILNNGAILNLGIRADINDLKSEKHEMIFYHNLEPISNYIRSEAIHYQKIAPSFSLSYQSEWKRKWNSQITVCKSTRLPNIAELTSNGVHTGTFRFEQGNNTLKPEQGIQTDWVITKNNKANNISFTPFFNYYFNYIYLTPSATFPTININNKTYAYPESGQLYQYQQAPVIYTGGEITGQYFISKNIKIGGSIEYIYAQNLKTYRFLPMIPPLGTKTYINYSKEHLRKNIQKISFRMMPSFFFGQNQIAQYESKTKGYALLDLQANFQLGNYADWIDCSITLQNVFNTTYYRHNSIYRQVNLPEPGRNIQFSIGWKYHYHFHKK